jgi:hypothetical protein
MYILNIVYKVFKINNKFIWLKVIMKQIKNSRFVGDFKKINITIKKLKWQQIILEKYLKLSDLLLM